MGLNDIGAPARSRAPWLRAPCSFQESFHGVWKRIFFLCASKIETFTFWLQPWLWWVFSSFFGGGGGGNWLFGDFHGFWKGIFLYRGHRSHITTQITHWATHQLDFSGRGSWGWGGGKEGGESSHKFVCFTNSPARWCVNWLDNKWERTTDQIYDFYHL